jgi:hypothetical protein
MDTMDRYYNHFKHCDTCKPATLADPVCVPCPTGQQLWNRHIAFQNRCAASIDDSDGPTCYPLGGFDEYND